MWYTELMATQPFNDPRDNGGSGGFSFSPSVSYLRPNIAVPDTSSKTAAQHATQADTDFEDRLPVLAVVASIATPASE